MGYVMAMGPCWSCGAIFGFNPDLVPSLRIDPETNRPADLGGEPERAVRQPICESCVRRANTRRSAAGQAPIEILPGAYDGADDGYG